jgi:hypothetical protein
VEGDAGQTAAQGACRTACEATGRWAFGALLPKPGHQERGFLAATLRRFAALEPRTLLAMHGSAFTGDGARVLRSIADGFASLAQAA